MATRNLEMVALVKKYRGKGLTFKEISKITGKDPHSLWRWYHFSQGKWVK